MGALYPLPDVLLLGWVAVGGITTVLSRKNQRFTAEMGDIQDRFYHAIKQSNRNNVGRVMVLFSFIAIVINLIWVWGAYNLLTGGAGDWGWGTGFMASWTDAGSIVCLRAAGTYGFWFWLREFRRISPFLDRLEKVGLSSPTLIARPVGLTIPPALLVLAVGLFNIGGKNLAWVRVSFAATWPILVAGLAGCAWMTTRIPPQSLTAENHIVTVSLAIQAFSPFLAFQSDVLIFLHAAERFDEISINMLEVFVAIVLLLFLTTISTASRYAYEHSGVRQYADVAHWLTFGVFNGLAAVVIGGSLEGVMKAVALLALSVAGLAAYERFDPDDYN
jgi:hypothetical protein